MQLQQTFFIGASPRMIGENFWIGLPQLKLLTGGNIYQYFLSATVDIYDSSGNSVLAAQPLTVDAKNPNNLKVFYLLCTGRPGTGRIITVPGTYRYVYTVNMSDNSVSSWEQTGIITGKPY